MAFKNEGMLWDKKCIYWIFVALIMKCELSRIVLRDFSEGVTLHHAASRATIRTLSSFYLIGLLHES